MATTIKFFALWNGIALLLFVRSKDTTEEMSVRILIFAKHVHLFALLAFGWSVWRIFRGGLVPDFHSFIVPSPPLSRHSSSCFCIGNMASEPDDLYTLRAQFWLGHYDMALDEARSIARRPMSQSLKDEREEFIVRCHLAKGEVDRAVAESEGSSSPGMQALNIYAKQTLNPSPANIDALKTLLADPANSSNTTLQLTAAHVFLAAGKTRDALECVAYGTTMEHLALTLQIYIRIDRIDLAKEQLAAMRSTDEDAILTQLGAAYVDIANGSSTAGDAIHHLNTLQEQYGASLMLLNCAAVAHLTAGNYSEAEDSLQEAMTEFNGREDADTLVNTVVCYQHLDKGAGDIDPILDTLKSKFGTHPYVEGLKRVEGALERESVKYKVEAIVA